MSTLTEALDRIFIRLQQKGFLTTSLLPPGLTPAEIEAIQALQDEHKEVRNMARRALDKLEQ